MLARTVNSLPMLYLFMMLPGWSVLYGLYDLEWYYPQMMYESGVWSIRFLIITVSVSPLLALINWVGRGKALGRWLLRRRRHFGLASAIYAGLHLLHYVLELWSLEDILFDLPYLEFVVGWLAVVLLAALAATSNGWSVRRLGRRWKYLHYGIYPAAALSFWHWYLFDYYVGRVVFWTALFCLPTVIQLALRWYRGRVAPPRASTSV